MDDDRIERALREGPPDEPAYVPGIARLQPSAEDAPTTFDTGVRRARGRVSSQPLGLSRWSAAIAAGLVVLVAGVALRFGIGPAASPTPGDLLSRIKAAGVIRIAVSNEAPQTQVAGGSYIGFDVDVANAIAEKLGVSAELPFRSPDEIFSLSGNWDIALPSHMTPDQLSAAVIGATYYQWPEFVVVAKDSTLDGLASLEGETICVVSGSLGATWLANGSPIDAALLLDPPHPGSVIERPSDADCFAAVNTGEAAAAVTGTLLDTDVQSRGMRLLLERYVTLQNRAVLIRDLGPLASPASLDAAIKATIGELRSSGQLAELSRRAFGGQDLTGVGS